MPRPTRIESVRAFDHVNDIQHGAVEYFISMAHKSSCRDPGHECEGLFKKVHPARPQPFRRAERTPVREHDKRARTPLAGFFNIPNMYVLLTVLGEGTSCGCSGGGAPMSCLERRLASMGFIRGLVPRLSALSRSTHACCETGEALGYGEWRQIFWRSGNRCPPETSGCI